MADVTISLSDEQLAQLRAQATQLGLTPEELIRRHVEQVLAASDETFLEAAEHVLKKNAELYRRLA